MPFMYRSGQLEAEALRLGKFFVTTYDRKQNFRWHPDLQVSSLWPSPPSKPCRQRRRPGQAVPSSPDRSRFPLPVSMKSDSSPDYPIGRSQQVVVRQRPPSGHTHPLNIIQCATSGTRRGENWILIQERAGTGEPALCMWDGSGPVLALTPTGQPAVQGVSSQSGDGRGDGAGCAC